MASAEAGDCPASGGPLELWIMIPATDASCSGSTEKSPLPSNSVSSDSLSPDTSSLDPELSKTEAVTFAGSNAVAVVESSDVGVIVEAPGAVDVVGPGEVVEVGPSGVVVVVGPGSVGAEVSVVGGD